MNQLKQIITLLPVIPLLLGLGFSSASAQTDAAPALEPSYEIALHVIIGSNESGSGAAVPASLSSISKHLKSNFAFTNYRLANTFLGRITNNGNIEYKSVSNILGQETEAEAQTFLEWSMSNIRTVPGGFQARPFRFGARVPVRVGLTKDPGGSGSPIVNYEAVGLNVGAISIPMNSPTLVGTISLPKTTGTIFLIATIRSAEL